MAGTTETKFDWSGLHAEAVRTLKAPTVHDVPKEIVALAQKSFDGVTVDGELRHNLRLNLGTKERAEAFAKHLKFAGAHVKPNQSSVAVYIDPDNDGHPEIVAWRAGKKRGRQAV